MELKEKDGKYYISFAQLKELGFEYPEKGTKVFVSKKLFDEDWRWDRFYEAREGWPGVYISTYISEKYKEYFDNNEVYLEVTPENFQYQNK
jgi:hypothetical protein